MKLPQNDLKLLKQPLTSCKPIDSRNAATNTRSKSRRESNVVSLQQPSPVLRENGLQGITGRFPSMDTNKKKRLSERPKVSLADSRSRADFEVFIQL